MTTTTTTAASMLAVGTTEPTVVPGYLPIVARARATKGKTIEAGQRLRSINVPEAQMLIEPGACHAKFAALLTNELHSLAKSRLDAAWSKDDPKEVPSAWFTVDGLLEYYAAEKQAMGIDAEKIKAWLVASATYATLPPAKQTVWIGALPKLASPGYRGVLKADAAAVILTKLDEADLLSPAGMFVSQRLTTIMEAESNADAF